MLIPVRGQNVFVERVGAGRPLVLIHGLGTPSVWNRIRGPLSRSHELVIVHLPGFGHSDPAAAHLSVHDHASLVDGILESLNLHGVLLAGISYGAQVAATLAAASPARVTALAVICGSGLMRRYRFLRWSSLFRVAEAAAFLGVLRNARAVRRMNGRLYADPRRQPAELVEEFHRMILDRDRRRNWFDCVRNGAVPEDDFASGLSAIRLPTLILWGREDRVIPVRYAEEFRRRISNATVEVFSDCGHALPLEQPAKTSGVLAAFADRHGNLRKG